jgi:gluconate kinase
MNLTEAYDYIAKNRPPAIHLGGKTSTGKSTFAKELCQQLGYKLIDLDSLVRSEVMEHFGLENEGNVFIEVYKNRTHVDWIEQLTTCVNAKLAEFIAAGQPVVMDGPVANPQTLQELLVPASDALLIYIHPKNLDIYERNLTSRFMLSGENNLAGLPAKFWQKIDTHEYGLFLKTRKISPSLAAAIKAYALESQISSTERLDSMRQAFDRVLVVEI